jgi:TonB family protein
MQPGRVTHSDTVDTTNVSYQLIAHTPPVAAGEVDSLQSAIEIAIAWGADSMLHVEHLSPPRSFYVGEAAAGQAIACDFLLAGTERLPLILVHDGRVLLVIPDGANAELYLHEQSIPLQALTEQGLLVALPDVPGARAYPLPESAQARIEYRGFTFFIKATVAARRVGIGGPPRLALQEHVWSLVSMAVHGLLLGAMYFLPPRASALSLDLLNEGGRWVNYRVDPSEKPPIDEQPRWLTDDEPEGGQGKPHADDQGQSGDKHADKAPRRFAVPGPPDNLELQLSRDQAKALAQNAGIIGVLRATLVGDPALSSVFGAAQAAGRDPIAAVGAFDGNTPGASFGFGGLGPLGTGRGGGGSGQGTLGRGALATLGRGAGGGEGSDYGHGAGGFHGHDARVPRVRSQGADVHGSLSKEVIRRVIGRHLNEVRYCYAQQLNLHPDLQGRVAIQFVVAPTGAVQAAGVASSDLANQQVEQCIVQAVKRWSFPAPEGGGLVVVKYPFLFSQTGN